MRPRSPASASVPVAGSIRRTRVQEGIHFAERDPRFGVQPPGRRVETQDAVEPPHPGAGNARPERRPYKRQAGSLDDMASIGAKP